jgi:hypothetical protein
VARGRSPSGLVRIDMRDGTHGTFNRAAAL